MASFSPFSILKRVVSGVEEGGMRTNIAVGDRFEHQDRDLSVWIVEKISNVSSSHLPLISLSREGRPDLKKILSLSVLEEGEDFRPTLQ